MPDPKTQAAATPTTTPTATAAGTAPAAGVGTAAAAGAGTGAGTSPAAETAAAARTAATTAAAGWRRADLWAFAFLALNIQAGVVATGPAAPLLRADLALTNSALGLVLAIPPVAMGAAAVPAALLARRLGPARTLRWAALLLAAGTLARALAGSPAALALATALMCAGGGIATAAAPLLVATRFADDPGLATALFTGGFAVGALAAAGLTGPVLLSLSGWGWRGALFFWGVLAAAAWLIWVAVSRRWPENPAADPGSPRTLRSQGWGPVLRRRTTWLASLLFGFQAMLFFTLSAWIPSLYTDLGYSQANASLPLLSLSVAQVPASFLLPLWAGRSGRPKTVLLLSLACTAAGLLGLALGPERAPWLWGTLLGFGLAGLFGVCMMLPVRFFQGSEVAAAAGVMLTLGYLLASVGPFLMGALRDRSGTYAAGLLIFTALAVPVGLMILGLGTERLDPAAAAAGRGRNG